MNTRIIFVLSILVLIFNRLPSGAESPGQLRSGNPALRRGTGLSNRG